jgi:hypothetical protein
VTSGPAGATRDKNDDARSRGHSPSNVSHHLKGIHFPATKDTLLKVAKENGAERDILDMIEDMPDMEFENIADVMKAYGEADREGED